MTRRLFIIVLVGVNALSLACCMGTTQGKTSDLGISEQGVQEERTIAPAQYFYPASQDVIYLASEQFLLCRRKDFCPLEGHFTPVPVPSPLQEKTVSAEPPQKRLEATVRSVVYFAPGSASLGTTAKAMLDQLLAQLNGVQLQDLRVVTVGYTDSTGSRMMNNTIAHGRAEAVASYFHERGFAVRKIVVGSRHTCCYVAPNSTAQGRAKNRRAEIWVESNDERAN